MSGKGGSVNYRLYKDGDAPSASVAKVELADNPAAIEWAKKWLDQHATHYLYIIERADRRFAASLIRTAGGQWYAIPKTGFLVVE